MKERDNERKKKGMRRRKQGNVKKEKRAFALYPIACCHAD
jgi:hypothetical protein